MHLIHTLRTIVTQKYLVLDPLDRPQFRGKVGLLGALQALGEDNVVWPADEVES